MSVSNEKGFRGFPLPVGAIIPFAGQIIPPSFLLCNGSAFSAVAYPILAKLIPSHTLPNIVGGVLAGGSTISVIPGATITNPSATLTVTEDNVPAFDATVASVSYSNRNLNGTGKTSSSDSDGLLTGSVEYILMDSSDTTTSATVTITNFVGQLNAHAGTPIQDNGAVNISNLQIDALAMTYIIKAGY
jgi:hypothetical protein